MSIGSAWMSLTIQYSRFLKLGTSSPLSLNFNVPGPFSASDWKLYFCKRKISLVENKEHAPVSFGVGCWK
jgi:hypothetical protein